MTEQELFREYKLKYDPDDYDDIFQIKEEELTNNDLTQTIIDIFRIKDSVDIELFFGDLFNKYLSDYSLRERLYYLLYIKDDIEEEYSELSSAEIDLNDKQYETKKEIEELETSMETLDNDFDNKVSRIEDITGENYYYNLKKLGYRERLDFSYDKDEVDEDNIDELRDLINELDDIKTDYQQYERSLSEFSSFLYDIEESLKIISEWKDKIEGYLIPL